MIGAINANSTQTFDSQLEMAKNAPVAFVPGESFPPEGGLSTPLPSSTTPTPTSSATSTTTTSPPAQTTSSAPAAASSDQSSSGFSTGAIVGVSLGAAAIAISAAAIFYLCGRQRMFGEFMRRTQAVEPAPYSPYHSPPYAPRMSPFPENMHHKVPSVDISNAMGQHYHDPGMRGMGGSIGDTRYHNHSPANEAASYRSRSPPMNEMTESVSPLFFPAPPNRPERPDWSNRPDWSRREGGAGQPNEAGFSPVTGYDGVSPTSINSRDIPSPLR
jgi:hypothetical protein